MSPASRYAGCERRLKYRQSRVVDDSCFDHRRELSERSALQSGRQELGCVEDERVGLAAFGTDLKGGFGALLGVLEITTGMLATAAVMKVLIHVRAGCWSRTL